MSHPWITLPLVAPADVGELTAALEAAYPPALAEGWDAIGVVCGDAGERVERVLLAVDPCAAVVDEAVAVGAGLLVTHHPLLLRPVSRVATDSPAGRSLHRLIRAGCALFVAHTNADLAAPGVSDALAEVLGLVGSGPLEARPGGDLEKVVMFVPAAAADPVIDALSAAGAGTIGGYTRCAFVGRGEGTFVGGAGTAPTVGVAGRREVAAELRVEMVYPRARRAEVVAALRAVHPYEEPAFDLYPLVSAPGGAGLGPGLGRIGTLPAERTLRAFTADVAAALPATAGGVRALGDPDRPVRRIAVCGGSGGELAAAAAAAGADVLVTADLRHHPASDIRDGLGLALIDAPHWATEWPWLNQARRVLEAGTTVEVMVSTIVTDPWSVHVCRSGSA